jgi:hypothetical protein
MAVSPRKRGRSYAPAWEPLGCEARRCQPLEPMQNRVLAFITVPTTEKHAATKPTPEEPVYIRSLARCARAGVGPRMVCTRCGIGADARPNWRDQPVRERLTDAQWQEPTSKGAEDADAEMIASVLSAIAIAAHSRCCPVRL